jgi:hypothetical protein
MAGMLISQRPGQWEIQWDGQICHGERDILRLFGLKRFGV